MFNALRRVISETSEIGGSSGDPQPPQQQPMQVEDMAAQQPQQHDSPNIKNAPPMSSAVASSSAFPHTIVMEDDEDNVKLPPTQSATSSNAGAQEAPLTLVHSTTAPNTAGAPSDTSSSLSDGSVDENHCNTLMEDEDEDMMILTTSPIQQRQVATTTTTPASTLQVPSAPTNSSTPNNPEDGKSDARNVVATHKPNAGKAQPRSQQPQQPPHSIPKEQPRPSPSSNTAAAASPTSLFQRTDSVANESSNDGGSSGSHRNGASSQTSSRDWGWFEDVHMGSETNMLLAPSSAHSLQGGSGGGGGTSGAGAGGPGGSTSSTTADGHDKRRKHAELLSTPQDIIHHHHHHTGEVNEEAAAMAVTAPTYVLEESLSSQKLWKHTAGNRPPQPMEERAFFEKMWAQNFARSQVNYSMPVEVLTASSPLSLNPFADGVFEGAGGASDEIVSDYGHYSTTTGAGGGGGTSTAASPSDSVEGDAAAQAALISRIHDMTDDGSKATSATYVVGGGWAQQQQQQQFQKVPGPKSDGDLTVLLRGPNAFGTTVSKSFARATDNGAAIVGVDTVNISLASYRVVESKKYGKYAQFLVIYREGSIRDTVGVWKRYRDFEELSHKVTQAHEGCAAVIANMSPLAMTEEPEIEHLPNAITSWRLLQKRKRWYRCLDAGYLSLKVFLLERFLHDILFESSSPKLLRDFVLGPGSHGPR